MTVQTHNLPEGATTHPTSRPIRTAWAVLGVFLLAFAVFEAAKHGGWTIPVAVLGLIAPDLSFVVGASGPHEPGQLPGGTVRAYNLAHRPALPLVVMAIPVVLGLGGSGLPFTFGLAWLAHIALDRALGFGLRTANGWPR